MNGPAIFVTFRWNYSGNTSIIDMSYGFSRFREYQCSSCKRIYTKRRLLDPICYWRTRRRQRFLQLPDPSRNNNGRTVGRRMKQSIFLMMMHTILSANQLWRNFVICWRWIENQAAFPVDRKPGIRSGQGALPYFNNIRSIWRWIRKLTNRKFV